MVPQGNGALKKKMKIALHAWMSVTIIICIDPSYQETLKPYVKLDLEDIGTLVSQAFSTKNIERFMPCYFILDIPKPAPDLESNLKKLYVEIQNQADENLPEKDIWTSSIYQIESIIKLSKEKITDSYKKNVNTYHNSKSIPISQREKRDVIQHFAQQGSWIGEWLGAATGLASLSDLLKVADEVDNNYDKISELWVENDNLFSILIELKA